MSLDMPIISVFFGIIIRIHFLDHPPPHLHAAYGELEALFDIQTGRVIEGKLPRPQARLVLEWIVKNRTELMQAWNLASTPLPTFKVPGLDDE